MVERTRAQNGARMIFKKKLRYATTQNLNGVRVAPLQVLERTPKEEGLPAEHHDVAAQTSTRVVVGDEEMHPGANVLGYTNPLPSR